jgi:amino acid transporter
LSFSGVEIATVHAKDVDKPQQKFPKAMAYASTIILLTLMAGSLAIAVVLPANEINLITGIIQSLKIFFHSINQDWAVPVMALSLAIGAAGSVSNWIIAPTRGLLFAAQDGNLPRKFTTINEHNAPDYLLKLQAIIVVFISLIFIYIPNINQSYWVLTVTATQLYMIMYIMMFASFLKLKYKNTNDNDGFTVPFGLKGAYLVALFGIIGCLITFIVSFLLPDLGYKISQASYNGILLVALIFSILPPFFLYKNNKP